MMLGGWEDTSYGPNHVALYAETNIWLKNVNIMVIFD